MLSISTTSFKLGKLADFKISEDQMRKILSITILYCYTVSDSSFQHEFFWQDARVLEEIRFRWQNLIYIVVVQILLTMFFLTKKIRTPIDKRWRFFWKQNVLKTTTQQFWRKEHSFSLSLRVCRLDICFAVCPLNIGRAKKFFISNFGSRF